jgi:hypothetical protein
MESYEVYFKLKQAKQLNPCYRWRHDNNYKNILFEREKGKWVWSRMGETKLITSWFQDITSNIQNMKMFIPYSKNLKRAVKSLTLLKTLYITHWGLAICFPISHVTHSSFSICAHVWSGWWWRYNSQLI